MTLGAVFYPAFGGGLLLFLDCLVFAGDLSVGHWVAYGLWCVFMGYTEGYKAFQRKFCPMVVARAATLDVPPGERRRGWWLHALFAPMYSMGLFHASRKRLIVSWSFVVGIASIVAAVCRALISNAKFGCSVARI